MTTLLETNAVAATCKSLLARRSQPSPAPGQKLLFAGVGERDVYNIAAPVHLAGQTILAGRVEHREVEQSEIIFFKQTGGVWMPMPDAPTFPGLQDPCITFIGGEFILGGVRFPIALADGTNIWRMEFYRGTSLNNLKLFLTGPDKMKDIRLIELPDHRIGVLTRPQGEKGGRGKIGFYTAASLEAITAAEIQDAPLFGNQCVDAEWLGANEAHPLDRGLLGVLGHIAYFDDRDHRHYYPMVFCVNPATGQATAPEIIACRSDFPPGAAKRSDLVDVMFSGGLVRHGDGSATLYAGLSDAEAGCLRIADPFSKFELPKVC